MTEQNPPSPLSDATLQEIRDRIHEAWDLAGGFDVLYGAAETVVTGDIYDLLDEVERLQKQVTAMREIVAFTAGEPYYQWPYGYKEKLVLSEEMQEKARALLANNG